ncbi:acetylxylan esterase [Aureliella helgolandensis]|nr:acetylxylan esterase [Aureliella helgolandensis]
MACVCGGLSLCLPLNAAEPELRDLDSHCPFVAPTSLDAWQARASQLREQLQVSLGLMPMIELDPVEPQIYGAIARPGYTIEKVTFDSLPGLKVTGNLYRPEKIAANTLVPAVLSPHGHWDSARFYQASPKEINSLLAQGAERFEHAAENHIQARCVQLARMGCIVFHWDMLGYCDSQQISMDRAHRFAKQPVESEVNDDGWLLFSPLAESHTQSVLGLQTLAIMRAVDMLLTLPEVDSQRIAITGASGGGTQSFLGAAIDQRISLAFPAVMVSTGMQGGCTCENCSLLRTGTGNVEMAGLIAPRPLGLTAANDWTKTMPTDGFPQLRSLYKLFGKESNVALFANVHFNHNFNHVSRTAMYGWINQHFNLGLETPVLESDFPLAYRDELTVWDAEHPAPAGGEEFERKLMKLWAETLDSQMQGWLQGDGPQLTQLAQTLRSGWSVALGLSTAELTLDSALNSSTGIQFLSPHDGTWELSPQAPTEADSESSITLTVGTGETQQRYAFSGVGETLQPLVPNPRLAAAYTFGYNLPAFAKRARQLALTLAELQRMHPEQPLALHARGSAAALAAAGVFCLQNGTPRSQTPLELHLDPQGFQFAKASTIRDPNFLPASARFGDLAGLLASLQSVQFELASDSSTFEQYRRLHQAAHNSLASAP